MKKRYIIIASITLIAVAILIVCYYKERINYEVITDKQIINQNKEGINYEVITDKQIINQIGNNSKERGYELIEKNGYYYLIITYGEQPTFYDMLEVTKVKSFGKIVDISVSLPKNSGFGDAFSYPKALIRFDQKPEKIFINYN